MFGRPISIWLILAFVTYGIIGTVSNFGEALMGQLTFSPIGWVFGLLALAGNIWLFFEIWQKGSRQALAAFCNAGILLCLYLAMLVGPIRSGDMEQIFGLLVLSGVMVGIWVVIGFYLRRFWRASK